MYALRVVRRRVRCGAVRDRLDERRAAAAARTLDGLARRLVHGEHVAAVDAHAGHAVADSLVGERLGTRLRGERRRDRPLVVVAEQDERRLHDRGEVRALVERALATSRRRRSTRSRRSTRRAASSPTRAPPRAARASRSARRSTRRCSRPGSTSRPDGPATTRAPSSPACRAAVRSPTRGSSGRSSPRRRARGPSPPASPRGSRRSRRCRCAPGGGRRRSARRTCGGGSASGRGRAGPSRRRRRPPVGNVVAVADHPPQVALRRQNLGHSSGIYRGSHEDVDRVALGLEHDVLDVAEILAVGLQRQRPVARDLDPVDVVRVEHVARRLLAAAPSDVRERAAATRRDADRRDEVEAELEPRLRRDVQREPARRTCTDRSSRRSRRPRDRGPATSSAGSSLKPRRAQHAHELVREREIARAAPVGARGRARRRGERSRRRSQDRPRSRSGDRRRGRA